jgi:hypothetical protein
MPRSRRQSIRTDGPAVLAWLAITLAVLGFSPVQAAIDQTAEDEARLRERITSYWQAMEKGDYLAASAFVLPEVRNEFVARVPKSRINEWTITELDFDEEGTECLATITVRRTFAMFLGKVVDVPLRNKWIFSEGEWYLDISRAEGEGSLVDLFKNQEASAQRTEPLKKAKVLTPEEAEAARRRASASAGRLQPDQENPSRVQFGQKATFKYHYENRTDSPIRILSVHSDCHCTAIQREHPEVAPGETATFQVVLDTFGLPPGNIVKNLTVMFSDLDRPLVAQIAIENLPNFEVTPERLDFGELELGQISILEVRIQNRSQKKVQLQPALHSDKSLGVKYSKKVMNPGEEIVVKLRYKSLSPGEFRDSVMLRTDLQIEPVINIWIRGRVNP